MILNFKTFRNFRYFF